MRKARQDRLKAVLVEVPDERDETGFRAPQKVGVVGVEDAVADSRSFPLRGKEPLCPNRTAMDLPLVTVITATIRARDGVARTIDSVRSQDYPNLEHVVVDGGYPDGTRELLEARSHEVARWVSEPDDGMADGFNKGVRLATGEAVIFMNAGDLFYAPDSLSRLVGEATELRKRILYGDAWVTGGEEHYRLHADHRGLDRRISLCHQAALIGLDLAREFPYDNRLIVDSDYDFWLRCRQRYGPDIFVKRDAIVCRYELGGASNDPRWAVHNFLSNHVSRMLNSGRKKHTVREFVWLPLAQITEYKLKLGLRRLLGVRLYLKLKTLLGR